MKLFLLLTLSFLTFSSSFAQLLIPIHNNGKWGYCDEAKEIKIDYQYESASRFNSIGLAIVAVKGKYGIINKKNEWEIKPKYASINFTLEDNELIVSNKKGLEGIIDVEGHKLLPLEYDSIKAFDHNNSYIAYMNNACGLYRTVSKRWELPFGFNAIEFNDYGMLEVTKDGSSGFVNEETYSYITEPSIIKSKTRGGKKLETVEFEEWEDIAVVKTNSGYNILNKKGEFQLSESKKVIIKEIDTEYYNTNGFKLPNNAKFIAGDIVFLETSDNKIEEADLENFLVPETEGDELTIQYLSSSKKYALFKDGEKVSYEYDSIFHYNDDFVQAITYDNGEKNSALLPITKNDNIKKTPVVEGFQSIVSYIPNVNKESAKDWVIIMNNDEQQGIFDLESRHYIVEMKYEQLYVPFVENYGLILVGNQEDKFAFFDVESHKLVTDMKYDTNINTEDVKEELLFIERKGKNGESLRVLDVFSLKDRKLTGKTINGYNIVKRKEQGTVHYSKKAFGWETNIDYELSEFAPDNYQYYFLQDKGDGQIGIGFLDDKFNVVLQPEYATVAFKEKGNPYIKVTDFEFNEGIISTDGKVIIPLGKYVSVGAMQDGIAPVEDLKGNKFFVNNKDEEYIVNH